MPPDTLAAILRARRSPHRFDPSVEVPADLLRAALDAATFAPNHKRTEPWRFHVLGPDARAALVEINAALVAERLGEAAADGKRRAWREIPCFVAVTQRLAGDAMRQTEDYAAIACAIQNLALVLHAGGIGTKWTTGPVTRDARFADLLGIAGAVDAGEEAVVGLLHIGAPAPDAPPRPARTSADAVTRWLP